MFEQDGEDFFSSYVVVIDLAGAGERSELANTAIGQDPRCMQHLDRLLQVVGFDVQIQVFYMLLMWL